MAAVPLVVSDSLCFIVNKYGKVSVKTLKIVFVRPLLIIVVERDYLRGTIVWSHL